MIGSVDEKPNPSAWNFPDLVQSVRDCRRCPSMDLRRRVLGNANGRLDSTVMFIAEAPGRFGGDATGVPLSHDASGRHFGRLLGAAQIDREALFITNAVLCNPRDAADRNRKPNRRELENCGSWLRLQVEVVNPRVVVTLGATALSALCTLEAHSYRLRNALRMPIPWFGRILIPLYHPSPLTRAWRSDAEQVEDFQWLGEYLRQSGFLR